MADEAFDPVKAGAVAVEEPQAHSQAWSDRQQTMAQQASEAGLPSAQGGRDRLIAAIGRSEQAGYPVQHFAGTPNEPTGDRAPAMDIENLVNVLRARETSGDKSVTRERAYWESELASSMTAKEWQAQTGEGDPTYQGQPKFDPVAAGAVLVEQSQPSESRARAFLQGAGIPTSIPELKETAKFLFRSPIEDVKNIYQGLTEIPSKVANLGQTLSTSPAATVATKPLSPEAFSVYGTLAGGLILPEVAKRIGTLRDVAFGKPEVEAAPLTEPAAAAEPVATEQAVKESQVAANKEIAPVTEHPEAIAEPFPSISRSAEAQRQTELQQEPSQIREPISLDELRLMRERNELQLQNELAKRVTGGTHPAVDERLTQIDNELTNIANRELQTKGGGEVIASEIPKDETRYGEGVRQEEGGNRGGENVEQTPQGNRPDSRTGPEIIPAAETPPSPAAEPVPAGERVQTGEFKEKGYTAVPTPAEAEAAAKGGEQVGIAERYREDQQPGSVIPGVGRTPDEARAYGHDFINKGGNPYDAINQKGPKRELWKDVGIARAEYERLSNEKRAAENALEADPNNPQLQMAFDNADMAQRKWSKDAQPILTRAGDALRAATRSYPREINSFSDFTDIVNDHFKGEVELTPEKRAELQKALKIIKKGNVEATDARAQVTDAAVKKAGGKTMSFDDLRADLKGTMEKLLEKCGV